jgi:hypothetical protein
MCYGGNINYSDNGDDDDDDNNNNNNNLVHTFCKNTGQRTLQKKLLLRISKMKHISIERYLDLMATYK